MAHFLYILILFVAGITTATVPIIIVLHNRNKSCELGYYKNLFGTCVKNTCLCENGIAAKGINCIKNGKFTSKCESCYSGVDVT